MILNDIKPPEVKDGFIFSSCSFKRLNFNIQLMIFRTLGIIFDNDKVM